MATSIEILERGRAKPYNRLADLVSEYPSSDATYVAFYLPVIDRDGSSGRL